MLIKAVVQSEETHSVFITASIAAVVITVLKLKEMTQLEFDFGDFCMNETSSSC